MAQPAAFEARDGWRLRVRAVIGGGAVSDAPAFVAVEAFGADQHIKGLAFQRFQQRSQGTHLHHVPHAELLQELRRFSTSFGVGFADSASLHP